METVLEKLLEINEEDFSEKANPGRWSKKEIISHLIGSATNNHHRFVRKQFEETSKSAIVRINGTPPVIIRI